jgi:hypothetical protein
MCIGGRDITFNDTKAVCNNLLSIQQSGLDREIEWFGLKGEDVFPKGEF